MYRRLTVAACLLVMWGLVFASAGVAGEFNKVLNVGDKAPGFEGLIGIDDESHGLGDYKEAKVVVLTFTCNHCPVAVAYEDRFVEFNKEYKDKGVAFVAVNVNNLEADKLDKMKERAEKKGFNFDYLYDSSQALGRAYGATCTPHVFVLDKERKIVYMGSFDNSLNPNKVKNNYARDAVDAVLSGSPIAKDETKQFGCGIVYESKN